MVAGRILDALSAPILLGPCALSVGASIGISLFPENGRDADTLMKKADVAMYQSKAEGKSRFRLYSESAANVVGQSDKDSVWPS
jgi:GGDEF domain-containing protein